MRRAEEFGCWTSPSLSPDEAKKREKLEAIKFLRRVGLIP
jgi:hypothetical protein